MGEREKRRQCLALGYWLAEALKEGEKAVEEGYKPLQLNASSQMYRISFYIAAAECGLLPEAMELIKEAGDAIAEGDREKLKSVEAKLDWYLRGLLGD